MARFAHESTALGSLQRSTAKEHGRRHKESLAEGNFGIERSYRKRLAKDMKHSAKHMALMAKVDAPNSKGLDIKR